MNVRRIIAWFLRFMFSRTFGRLFAWLIEWSTWAELPDYDAGFALPASGRHGGRRGTKRLWPPASPTRDPREIPVDDSVYDDAAALM